MHGKYVKLFLRPAAFAAFPLLDSPQALSMEDEAWVADYFSVVGAR